MDDSDCCDSTWEEDEEDAEGDAEGPEKGVDADGDAPGDTDEEDDDDDQPRAGRHGAFQARVLVSRNWRAMQDMCRYRHHYPDLVEPDCNGDMPNLSFYKNEIRFLPNGCFIEEILQDWREDYQLLEDNHSYIQWLFPLREPGVNWHAKPLTLREVEAFKSCPEVMERFVQAYELMLGFYGVELQNRDTGAVRRAHNYQRRFQNLNWHSHNNLRITRILKSLGELGLEQYQAPLAHFFLEETLVRRQLQGVRQSALDYFVFAVRCRRQRRALLRFAWEHFRPRSKFVWAPHDKLQRLLPHQPGDNGLESLHDKAAQGQPSRPGGPGGDGVPQESESPKRELDSVGVEVRPCGEQEPAPTSPIESKKRKLEVNRGDPGPQSPSEVERIALNLEGCALSQGSLGTSAQDAGTQDLEEEEQPCTQPTGAKVADEVRKRRKVDEGTVGSSETPTPAPACTSAASRAPENVGDESGGGEGALNEAGSLTAEEGTVDRSPAEGPSQALAPLHEEVSTATPTEP
ncbi:PREDICTED: opioid growth factor receptor [Elephantulus edwardii]|uniref:opioid growth factor receptor n=1 Tax=Elephantulus edwardii TaxID=28737 RepID=UPI0003F064A6|nr:PREDICTED: opioid growth factor receptor [Elephantulus edwardii]